MVETERIDRHILQDALFAACSVFVFMTAPDWIMKWTGIYLLTSSTASKLLLLLSPAIFMGYRIWRYGLKSHDLEEVAIVAVTCMLLAIACFGGLVAACYWSGNLKMTHWGLHFVPGGNALEGTLFIAVFLFLFGALSVILAAPVLSSMACANKRLGH